MSHYRCRGVSAGALLTLAIAAGVADAEILVANDVMVAGSEGYSVYRIPGFAVAHDGSLLLAAEGRPSGADPGAPGDIDFVYKRSTDGGNTWTPLEVLHHREGFDFSDPRLVVDRNTGTVHMQYVQWPTTCGQTCVPTGLGDDSSVIYHLTSTDHGLSWSEPTDINAQVKDPTWASLNTGPGIGIQLQWQDGSPSRNGRLLMPAHQRPSAYRGVALYSDDGGVIWNHGSGVTPHFADESEVIELTNGDLMWDGRRGGAGRNRSISHDGGDTWVDAADGDIPISAVDSGMVRYSAQRSGHDRDRILYSGPLGSPAGAGNGRSNIGVWTSYDEGKTFINPVQIESGSAAYSVIDRMQDGTIGLIYETHHSTIRFVNFDLTELEDRTHSASLTHYDGFGNEVDRRRGGIGWSGSWQGEATFTDEAKPQFGGGSSVAFPGLGVSPLGGRVDFAEGEANEISRSLVTQVSLGQSQTTYFSMVFSGALDQSFDESSDESLVVELRDASGVAQVSFGVDDEESFFVDGIGDAMTTQPDTIDRRSSYFLLAKVVSHNNGAAENFDQVFLKAFRAGVDLIPEDDDALDWTLVGDTTENLESTLESVAILSGELATWSIDDLRFGTTFDAVTGMLGDGDLPNGLIGDVNQDGVIFGDGTGPADNDDVTALLNGWQSSTLGLPAVERIKLGDLNLDGATTLSDIFILHQALEDHGAAFPFQRLGALGVPEPSAMFSAVVLFGVCVARAAVYRSIRSTADAN